MGGGFERAERAEVRFSEQNSALVKEILTLRADLAAARAALKRLWDEVKDDYVSDVWGREDQKEWVEAVLSRLGTEEALAAVREAQAYLAERAVRESSAQAGKALARLRAAFGGEV